MVYSMKRKDNGLIAFGLGAVFLLFLLPACSPVPDGGGSAKTGLPSEIVTSGGGGEARESLDLDEAVESLASQIAASMTAKGKKNVAILDFVSIRKEPAVFGQFLSEELISRLFLTGKFKVIERRFLDQVMQEQELTVSDFFESQSVGELGRLLGVEAGLLGTFTDVGGEVRANGRLISTESGELFAVAMASIAKDAGVAALLRGQEEESKGSEGGSEPVSAGQTEAQTENRPREQTERPIETTVRRTVPPAGETYAHKVRVMSESLAPKALEVARDLQKDPGFAEYASARDWALVSLTLSSTGRLKNPGKLKNGRRGVRVERSPSCDAGLPAAQRAIKLNPKDPAAQFAWGYALFLKGNVKDARPQLEKALDADARMESVPIVFRKEIFEAVRRMDGKPPHHR